MDIVRVVLENAAPSYDRAYDYRLPEGMTAAAGCRVLVPFGRGRGERIALVLSHERETPGVACKEVRRVLDTEPLLNEEGLYLLRALRATTFCTWGDALHVLIPPGAGMKLAAMLEAVRGRETDALTPDARRLYGLLLARRRAVWQEDALRAAGLCADAPALAELLENGYAVRRADVRKRVADERAVLARLTDADPPARLTEKQRAALDFLSGVGCATVREIGYYAGVTRAVVDRLRAQGLVELFEEVVPRALPKSEDVSPDPEPITLSPAQQRAFDTLLARGRETAGAVSLLYGVTGSGKTQIYLRLIEETLRQNRRVLVLVPEISLTPQITAIFFRRFGGRVAVLHSSLSVTERLDEWRRIRAGGADIVVGTRSAVFAPLDRIGLIVIDEEQEHTYHSEKAPRYHAREIAKLRARRHGAHLLLCSATPSIESMAACEAGRAQLVRIGERYTAFGLPEVVTIDLRTAPLAAGSTLLSEELCEALCETFSRGEQAILLLNRRGYNTMVRCSACREAARCPNCSIPLAYHSANGRLVCHYCGHTEAAGGPCAGCGAEMLRYTGAGTQRAEEELQAIFPDCRLLRLDADTTMSRFSHRDKFAAFARGEYNCMIGTQMIAKGLDFPNVTLVGVLCADQSLYSEDFRALERTFSLVTQVVGRCGRADKPGRAVIQTYTPEHRVLQLAAAQDYDTFYREELGYRRVGLYPPYCELVCAVFAHEREEAAVKAARRFQELFIEQAKASPALPLRLIGPAEGVPYRAAGRYRCRLLIKCRNDRAFRAFLQSVIDRFAAGEREVFPAIDCYYDSNV